MSIRNVLRALDGLQEALVDTEIRGSRQLPNGRGKRHNDYFVMAELPDMFRSCADLSEFSVEASLEYEEDVTGARTQEVYTSTSFSFDFEVMGRKYSINAQMADSETIDDAIEGLIQKTCGADTENAQYQAFEAKREIFNALYFDYQSQIHGGFHGPAGVAFWANRKTLEITRNDIDRCLIQDRIDHDALRALVLLNDRDLFERQVSRDGPPQFWNAAQIAAVGSRLRQANVDPQAPDANGTLPLVAACALGNQEAVAMLLDAGADPNCADANGMTAVTAAVAGNQLGLLPFLKDRGADLDGTRDVPSLLVAIASNDGGSAFAALLEAGADLHARTEDGISFASTFEVFLDQANDDTRSRVTSITRSRISEEAIRNALGDGGQERTRISKSTAGFAL